MYLDLEKSSKKDDSFIFKLIAVMAAIVIVVVICIAVSTSGRAAGDDTPTAPAVSDTTAPPETEPGANAAVLPEDTETELPPETTPETEVETKEAAPSIALQPGTVSALEGIPAGYEDVVLGETEDMGQEYIDKITFFGDSTTYGLKPYKMLSGGRDTLQVWTPSSGTLSLDKATIAKIYYPDTGEEILFRDAMTLKKPEYLLITLGVNGISYMDESTFKTYYQKVVNEAKEASPDTKIILQSIYPVSTLWTRTDDINNDKIRTANLWILDVAKTCGVKFLNSNPALQDETGYLPLNYQNGGDGMHLDTPGFTAVLNYIRTHGYQ